MGFSFLPREDEYFTLFSQMTEKIKEAASILIEMMAENAGDPQPFTTRIKQAEHACDDLMHKVTTKLDKSFITPFDREDIYTLSIALDDICDYIDAGARAVIMFGITEFNEPSRSFARIIGELANEIHAAVSVLNKPTGMTKHFVEVHRLENEADDIFFRAIGQLFRSETDPINLIRWKELYEILENATDRCESVANIIESIVLKHN